MLVQRGTRASVRMTFVNGEQSWGAGEAFSGKEKAAEERASLVESYTLESDLTKAVLLDTTAPTAPAAEEPAEGKTAE